jgi:nicotinamide riboside kinase
MTSRRILIMGLPGSGKTTLADELHELILSLGLRSRWLNENRLKEEYPNLTMDQIQEMANDATVDYVVGDFEARKSHERRYFNAHYMIWINTIAEEDYQFLNYGFEPPFRYNVCVTTKDAPKWAREIFRHILFLENIR